MRRSFSIVRWCVGAMMLLFAQWPAWAALATDAVVSTNRSSAASSISSPSFSTSAPGEVLLAFVAADAVSPGVSVTSVSGAGLAWALARRANAQPGTAEIWWAFAASRLSGAVVQASLSQSVAASITIVSFTGADGVGNGAAAIGATGGSSASAGAPSASLVTTRDNSWVFGVGNDYDNAVARAVPAGQSLVNQYLASIGDTYWVQRQNAPTSAGGSTVTINDTAPTADRYNLAIVEVRPPSSSTEPPRLPDLSVIIPTGRMAIAGTGSSRVLQYTHDTFNGGSGPLVIQPQYNMASGAYLGTQYLYAYSAGAWTLLKEAPLAGTFVFHAEHGHFHFPFASFGLYAVRADGGPGAPVAPSQKIGFCIADSFIYDATLPNAGALGNLGSCADPTSLRGLDIGAVDEYDKTDPGQSILLAGVPDGTYWLRAVVDPEGFLTESDESNNETDVLVNISGSTVTEIRQAKPALPPPPAISLTSPADLARVSGTIALQANAAAGARVQYLLNGQPLGSPVPAPFTLSWDTTATPDGSNWLAAQTLDPATGRKGTSRVARVTVANGSTRPPVVTVSSPEAGSTVSSVTALSATVSSSSAITGLQFYVDGVAVGARLTATPYLFYWDSRSVGGGSHTVTAAATDSYGFVGTSGAVTFNVDNSHPPNKIGIDAKRVVDGTGAMTTPVFSTTTPSSFLVAFVAYDGPATAPQTASVNGAGLTWLLMARSNSQRGTSEIWVAKAGYVLSNVSVTSQPAASGFHGSLVVMAFTNAAGPGVVGRASAPTGAPAIYLPGVTAGDWVYAVGNDWDNAIARVPVAGQVLVHQRVDTSAGDTFWVQSTAAPSSANALVDIRDSSPTTDQWNYAAIEIVATRP